MQKLILAQDTSNMDDTDMSSEDIRERDKKRRRIKAQRKFSSSEEDEELITNNENRPTKDKKFPPFPQIKKFMSSTSTPLKEKFIQRSENISDDIFISKVSNNNF